MGFLAERPDIGVIFPTEDIYIAELADHRDRLPAATTLVMPSASNIRLSDDKLAMHRLIEELGIPQARYATARGKAELTERCDLVGYPCVLLHIDSYDESLGWKAIIVESRRRLDAFLAERPELETELLIRAYARGTRYNYYFVAQEGRILDGVQMKITLTNKLDGTGNQVESCSCAPQPDITRHSEKLIAHLNYSGPGMTQFIIDEADGKVAFLEVNPRLGANCAMARRAGVDLVRLAFETVCGTAEHGDCGQGHYREGLRFAWLGGSLRGLRRSWHNQEIGSGQALAWLYRALVMSLRADAHICWSWRDPLPGLAGLSPNLLYSLRKRLLSA